MSIPANEQETTIQFSRTDDTATVYTSDTTKMTKLDKLCNSDKSPLWKLKEVHTDSTGAVVGKTYETNKRLISFRASVSTRDLTDEQREALSQNIKRYWENKKSSN